MITFLGCLSLVLLVAGVASRPQPDAWFRGLRKPRGCPPCWSLGLVWTALYATLAVALCLVWQAPDSSERTLGLGALATQLLLHAAWGWVLFRNHAPFSAFCNLLGQWPAALTATLCFHEVLPLAGWLVAPCLGWLSVTLWFTFRLWRLNPTGLPDPEPQRRERYVW